MVANLNMKTNQGKKNTISLLLEKKRTQKLEDALIVSDLSQRHVWFLKERVLFVMTWNKQPADLRVALRPSLDINTSFVSDNSFLERIFSGINMLLNYNSGILNSFILNRSKQM